LNICSVHEARRAVKFSIEPHHHVASSIVAGAVKQHTIERRSVMQHLCRAID
jgi:hypothetical protein